MKLICVQDVEEAGFVAKRQQKIAGITKNKKYCCYPCASDDQLFMVYNDDGIWDYYAVEWFKPE